MLRVRGCLEARVGHLQLPSCPRCCDQASLLILVFLGPLRPLGFLKCELRNQQPEQRMGGMGVGARDLARGGFGIWTRPF